MSAADVGRLALLAAVWGLAFVFIRVAVVPLGPFALVALRLAIASVVLIIYVRWLGVALRGPGRWRKYAVVALFNSAVPFTLIAFAQQELTASYTVILVSTSPLWAALLAAAVLDEPLGLRRGAGLALGIAGVALLAGWSPAGAPPPAWTIACGLVAAALYAVAGVYTRLAVRDIPPLATAAGSQLAAAVLLLPFVPFAPPAAAPTLLEWANVIALALASSALAFILYFQLIRNIGPVRTLTVNFLTPVFGVGGGALLLGERITANMIAGTGLILLGTALVTFAAAQPAPVRPML
jgi:drug/metabolite transporter (DMT)-like permease